MKKILKATYTIIFITISLAVIYTIGFRSVFYFLDRRALSNSVQTDLSEYGKGLSWVEKEYTDTLFFIPSSREIASEKLYGDWLQKIHRDQKVNIIIPPFDMEGSKPYLWGENESVNRRTDMIVYLYKLYSDQMGENHKITIVTTGDGSLIAFEIAKKYSTMDKLILISPVHSSFSRQAGSLFHKMEGLPIIPYIIPWLVDSYGENRIGPYDILNDNLNEQFTKSYGMYYPRYMNFRYKRDVIVQTDSVMNEINTVKENRFFIIYGDDDLSYGLEGFERMGDQLTESGSEVSIMRVPQSGRMILFDNGRDRIIDLISILLQ